MFGRHSTLVGRILAAVAIFTVLTGASEEAGGVIIHVELARAEHPAPDDLDSWDGVIPSAATGEKYYWAPTGWVLVQRTDGSVVRAHNDFDRACYMARVSVLKSRTGRWFVASVERPDDSDEVYEPTERDPMGGEAEMLEVSGDPAASEQTTGTDLYGDRLPVTSDGDVAQPQDGGVADGYDYLNQLSSP